MLTIFRRHSTSCRAENPKRGRSYWRCACPIWVQGSLGGQTVRQSLDVTSREAASRIVNEWNATGVIGRVKEEPARIDNAVALFLEAKRKKFLADATLKKLRTIFEKQFLAWAKDHGYRYLDEPHAGTPRSVALDVEGRAARGVEEVSARRWLLLILHAYEVDSRESDAGA